MKILLCCSEVAPIIKIGGLGDVAGALPKALEKISVNMDVIVPYFPSAKTQDLSIYKTFEIYVPFGGKDNTVSVYKTKLPGSNVDVYLLQNAEYFATGGVGFFDNSPSETQSFAFFDRAVVEFVKSSLNTYDIVHCNDWHTGLITHLLEDELGKERPRTLFTIHNLNYQGIGDSILLRDTGIIPGQHPLIDWDLSDGDLNMMQQGVTSSDYINTVSPTYAQEILTKEFGSGLEDILKSREARLSGILNGVDYSSFCVDYDENNYKKGKRKAKIDLVKRLGLEENIIDKHIISFVGRIDSFQKGLDILVEALPQIVDTGAHFVLLGTGDKKWEQKLKDLAEQPKLKGRFSCNLTFDNDLATQIYLGSDFLLVPSRYEPCGLIQMIAMRFGTLPIVHAVGGLKDSVVEGEDGFVFRRYSSAALVQAVKEAVSVYGTAKMDHMVKNAMRKDFSWTKSALEYKKLYEKILS